MNRAVSRLVRRHGPAIDLCRQLSMIKNKHQLSLNKGTSDLFEQGLKHRRHPGARRHGSCDELPYKLQLAATSIINKYRSKKFRSEVERIRQEFLNVMVEQEDENLNQNPHIKKISVDHDQPGPESFNQPPLDSNSSESNLREIRKNFFMREPYNSYECAAYMTARLPANYSALSYIFKEIQREEPHFRPSTLFDFGSGVGTTIWAADELWKGALKEIFCVDLNENMNELSRELLQNGTSHSENLLDRTFYRQFLPVKHTPMYDLVVCSFSLLEFPDTRSRIYLVENLWKKTSGMLVFVEHGSKAGFAAMMEARNFVLQVSKKQLDPLKKPKKSGQISQQLERPEGSVVAPCPHDLVCPRHSELLQKSYCNFSSHYKVFDYGQPDPVIKSEKFSYVVIKKHGFNQWSEEQKTWPRIVQPVVKKSNHSICRLCTSRGELNEIILSKRKTEKHMYRCARVSKWGDRLPASIVDVVESEA